MAFVTYGSFFCLLCLFVNMPLTLTTAKMSRHCGHGLEDAAARGGKGRVSPTAVQILRNTRLFQRVSICLRPRKIPNTLTCETHLPEPHSPVSCLLASQFNPERQKTIKGQLPSPAGSKTGAHLQRRPLPRFLPVPSSRALRLLSYAARI